MSWATSSLDSVTSLPFLSNNSFPDPFFGIVSWRWNKNSKLSALTPDNVFSFSFTSPVFLVKTSKDSCFESVSFILVAFSILSNMSAFSVSSFFMPSFWSSFFWASAKVTPLFKEMS